MMPSSPWFSRSIAHRLYGVHIKCVDNAGRSVSYKTNFVDKRIDQQLIKASGQMFLGKKLAIDDEVTLGHKGMAIREEVGSNQGDLVNECYVFNAIEVQIQ
jgi:hypothetical protein